MGELVEFSVASHSADQVVEEVTHSLWLNGYCQLELGLESKLDELLAELDEFREAEPLKRPPPEVVDGLLGDDGSSGLAWFSDTWMTDSALPPKGGALRELAKDLRWLGSCTQAYCSEAFDIHAMRASDLAVIRGGAPVEEEPELDEEGEPLPVAEVPQLDMNSCDFWMSLLFSAKIQVLYFLGPGEGKLVLDPYDEESEPITIRTRPDMVLIIRSDALQCKLTSTDRDYTLSSWISIPNAAGPRGWNTFSEAMMEKNPTFKALSSWAEDRLEQLMLMEVKGELSEDTPRRWQRWMRATYFRHSNLPVAVTGTGCHLPGSGFVDTWFKTLMNGVDYVMDIPLNRWDHAEHYDPDPDCWMQSNVHTGGITKTSVKHHTFVDGVDLFDHKFFQISQSEATGMEPQQRHILETSYEALQMAGYNKKSLMNSYIAVFSGSTHPESAYINYCTGAGAGNQSQAIISNRTSFVFGCMGPSTSIDCEHASSAMAIHLGCAAVAPNHDWRHSTGGHSQAAITGGVYIAVAGPFMWPRFHMHMNPRGRSFTWDAMGEGYVRGEGCVSIIQKPYTEKIDDEWVVTGETVLSTIVGCRMVSNGKAASLTAPSAPAIMESVDDALQDAGIARLDLDAIECYGCGGQLEDSVEVSAFAHLLRNTPDSPDEPLNLGAVKTNTAAQCEACAIVGFIKVMGCIRYATNCANLHLKQLNPHIEGPSENLQFSSEALAYRDEWAFHGAQTRGWGGINAHIVQWFKVDPDFVRIDKVESTCEPMTFWPGGGGHLAAEDKAMDDYHIVGSFNSWKPEPMDKTEDGHWAYTVSLGMNRYETFQVWLDGDSNKVLHPPIPRGPSASVVKGPSKLDRANGLNWMLDGRVIREEPAAGAEGAIVGAAQELAEYSTRDRGKVGDQYEIKLSILGKYRAVSWRKVKEGADDDALRALQGTYYVTGTFNDWSLSEMTASEDVTLGLHTIRIGPLAKEVNDFQIVRNRAWDQRFHPSMGTIACDSWDEYEVEGPDDGGHGKNWCLKGKKGDFFTIEFQRSLSNGVDVMRIAWRRVE